MMKKLNLAIEKRKTESLEKKKKLEKPATRVQQAKNGNILKEISISPKIENLTGQHCFLIAGYLVSYLQKCDKAVKLRIANYPMKRAVRNIYIYIRFKLTIIYKYVILVTRDHM